MRRLTRLYLQLDSTTSTNEKVDALESYFRQTPSVDAAWTVALLTGHRPKGSPSSRLLRELAIAESHLPEWLFDECHAAVGDLSETVALLLPPSDTDIEPEPLHELIQQRVLPLRTAPDDVRRQIIVEAWQRLTAPERLVYHKLLRGGLRIGIQRRTLARALAEIANVSPAEMAHRLAGTFRPTAAAFDGLISGQSQVDATRPFPFFLAQQLDSDPAAVLGSAAEWQAEWKWDGVRAQLIRRSHRCTLWSRGDEMLNSQFPELVQAANELPDGVVLDGEILLWRHNAPLPFSALQHRLGRTMAPSTQLRLFQNDSAIFLAFDMLERDGRDLRSLPLSERRAMLESFVPSGTEHLISEAPIFRDRSWRQLGELRAQSRDRGVEGLMLKHLQSTYGVGRTKPDGADGWWKWKVDPYTVDAVMVYAQLGNGRRASLYTDYTFALWDRGAAEPHLSPFARAYSGLTNEEIEQIDVWIRRHTIARKGPVCLVEPELVFEIAFESIQRSKRHKSGLAVRFPRILRRRPDKPPDQADSIEALRRLLPKDEAS